jgi:hypothetical protein
MNILGVNTEISILKIDPKISSGQQVARVSEIFSAVLKIDASYCSSPLSPPPTHPLPAWGKSRGEGKVPEGRTHGTPPTTQVPPPHASWRGRKGAVPVRAAALPRWRLCSERFSIPVDLPTWKEPYSVANPSGPTPLRPSPCLGRIPGVQHDNVHKVHAWLVDNMWGD